MIDALLGDLAIGARVRDAARRAQPWLERRDARTVAVRARVLRAFLDEGIGPRAIWRARPATATTTKRATATSRCWRACCARSASSRGSRS